MVIKKLLEEFDEEIIRAFVQKNSDYYLLKWKLMAETFSKTSWNWASFLLGMWWLVYRKMYLYAFLLFLITLITWIPILGWIVALVIWVSMGLFGNYIYGQYVYKKLKELSLIAKSNDELRMLAMQKGGTSILAVVVLIVLFLILEFILVAISVGSSTYNSSW